MDKTGKNNMGLDTITENDTIIVGVSGGVDSMVLLAKLLEAKDKMALRLVVVHINHTLRGKDANKDQLLVEEFCKKHGLDYVMYQENVEALAKERKNGFEEAGRVIRYQRFFEVMDKYNGDKIALAHHNDDAIETFFLKLFRGTGINGLASIIDQRLDGVVRPLLGMTKEEIYCYANDNDVPYNEDLTNTDSSYERNKIRNKLLPYIEKEMRVGAIDGITKTIQRVRKEQDFILEYTNTQLDQHLRSALGGYYIADGWLSSQHESIQYRIIYQTLIRLIGNEKGINEEKVYQTLGLSKTGTKVIINDDVSIERAPIGLYVYSIKAMQSMSYDVVENCALNSVAVYEYWDNIDKLSIRYPKPGDRVKLKGMKNLKRLNRYFIDEKVPSYQREYTPLLVDDQQIVAIVGYRQCEIIDKDEKTVIKPAVVTVVRTN